MTQSIRWSALCGTLAIAAVMIGCGSATVPDEHSDAPLQTDRPVYQLQRDISGSLIVDIPFTYDNGTGKTVYLVNCKGAVPPSLEKWRDGEWVHGWSPVLPQCLSSPIQIAPGALYEDTLRVYAARKGSNAAPQFEAADPTGTYRLVWHVTLHNYDFDNPPAGTPLALENRISNTFQLRAP